MRACEALVAVYPAKVVGVRRKRAGHLLGVNREKKRRSEAVWFFAGSCMADI